MKRFTMVISLLLLLVAADASASAAPGRFERGRTLYHERCAICTSMGWTWTPGGLDPAKVDVIQLALTLSPEAICTWQRRTVRPMKARCPADAMSLMEKIDVLYYLRRRLEGAIPVPRLERTPLKKATALRFKPRVPLLKRAAESRDRLQKAREEFIRNVLKNRRGPDGRPAAPTSTTGGR